MLRLLPRRSGISLQGRSEFLQAESAPGILFSGVKEINKVQHTLTAWESKDHMLAYIHSGAHLKALKAFRKIAVGKTFGYIHIGHRGLSFLDGF